jgi:hypothetical protein
MDIYTGMTGIALVATYMQRLSVLFHNTQEPLCIYQCRQCGLLPPSTAGPAVPLSGANCRAALLQRLLQPLLLLFALQRLLFSPSLLLGLLLVPKPAFTLACCF